MTNRFKYCILQDMSSLMHTIYEVVDQSVNHSSNTSKTLRVKLTVSPEPSTKKRDISSVTQGKLFFFYK